MNGLQARAVDPARRPLLVACAVVCEERDGRPGRNLHLRGGAVKNRHPNASVSLASGAGVGTLLVYVLSELGVELAPEAASAIAGAVSAVALFVGRKGFAGAWRAVRRRLLYGRAGR